jgi:hypothetical protein
LVNFGKQKARGDLSRGPVNFSDDVSMQVFCPTGQAILGKHERTGMSGTRVKIAATYQGWRSGFTHRMYQSSMSSPFDVARSGKPKSHGGMESSGMG